MLFLARVSPPFVVNLILCPRLCVPWVSLISALIGQVALWVRIACPFSAPPPDWRLIVAVHPRPLGCPLFCCFGWILSVFFRWLSPFAWLCAFVGSCLFCGLSVSPPFALGLSVVLLVVWCGCLPPFPLGCSRVASWPNQASAGLVPPSGYLVASCDGLVALPVAWSVVVLCFLASCCSTAAKAFGPVWGNWFTLYTLGHMLLWGFALLH